MIDLDNISFDHCIKCTVCTVYCPVARATHHFFGPKQSGPDAERMRIKDPELVDSSLKYCTNCKRCEIVCPSDVKIADIIQTARFKYTKKHFRPRDFFMSHTDLSGRAATMVSPIANTVTKNPIAKKLIDFTIQVPSQRDLPAYDQGNFASWFKKQQPAQKKFARKVVYFHGCYVNYNDHALGKTVVSILNALGYGAVAIKEKCCGVPLIANGYLKKAGKNARYNTKTLSQTLEEENARIVSASSSCMFALKSEYPHLLDVDTSRIADRLDYITSFLAEQLARDDFPSLRPVKLRAVYHAPCHLERMGGVLKTLEVLRKIPGLSLTALNSECCGMSGTYGFKKEYYEISQAIGSKLFEQIKQFDPDVVITDCETCKWQIESQTGYRVEHPVKLLARALGCDKEAP